MEVFQAKYIPPQEIPKPEHLFENMETKALFYSWPPLAQVTEVPKDLVDFTVCLQTDDAGLAEVWEVEVWYWLMEQEQGVAEQSSWGVSQLKQAAVAKNNRLSFLNGTSADVTPRIVFTGTILAAGALRFTIKFRSPSRHQSLIDVKDHQGIQNGFLVVKYDEVEDDDSDAGKHVASEDIDQINEVITGIPEEFRVVKVQSQSPGTQVWDVEAPAKGAVDDKCSVEELQFGKPWGGKYFRLVMLAGKCFEVVTLIATSSQTHQMIYSGLSTSILH